MPVQYTEGSNYPIVVLSIMMTYFIILQHNLLYVAATRAKIAPAFEEEDKS